MNSFERDLFGEQAQIPLHEASAYFLSMRRPSLQKTARALTKTAGWEDPPDETGVLEGQFEVPVENAVNLMGNAAMMLLRLMTATMVYAESVRGAYAGDVKNALRCNEYDHKRAFEYLIGRMTVLAGAPHVPEIDMPPPSTEPIAVAQRMIRAEQEMLNAYHELVAVLGKNPMKEKIKCFMGDCQEHLDAYWMAIPPEYGVKPTTPQPPVMMAKHEENETPEQEAAESPEFEEAEQAAGVEEPAAEEAPPDVKTAAARMVKWAKEGATDAELKEVGRQRAVTNISAEHHRESARRGERAGRTIGMLGGAAGGAALGHVLGKGHPAATLGGAALGGVAGRHLGSEVGTEADIVRHRKTGAISKMAAAMVAWAKQADDLSAGMPDAEAPMASPTDNAELTPVNYMNAELMGQQAQNRNEAKFYRQQVQQAQLTAQQTQEQAAQQVQAVQQQAAQAMQDAATADTKVKAALDEATRAHDEALQQTETAARMRMATQNLRMQLMQLASVDPDEQAALSLAATTGAASMTGSNEAMAPDAGLANGPPNPTAAGDSGGGPPGGPAGAAPDLQTAPGAAPPAGSPDMNANAGGPPGPDPNTASSTSNLSNKTGAARRPKIKTAGALGAGVGAALGAGGQALKTGLGARAGTASIAAQVAKLEGAQDGGYRAAAALANARSALAQRELAVAHPTQTALRSAGGGALKGAVLGSAIETHGRDLYNLLSQ